MKYNNHKKGLFVIALCVSGCLLFLSVGSSLGAGKKIKSDGFIVKKNLESNEIWINIGKDRGIIEGQLFNVYRNNIKQGILKAVECFYDLF